MLRMCARSKYSRVSTATESLKSMLHNIKLHNIFICEGCFKWIRVLGKVTVFWLPSLRFPMCPCPTRRQAASRGLSSHLPDLLAGCMRPQSKKGKGFLLALSAQVGEWEGRCGCTEMQGAASWQLISAPRQASVPVFLLAGTSLVVAPQPPEAWASGHCHALKSEY